MNPTIQLVRYGEIALKSKSVRNRFEKKLVQNISAMLKHNDIPFSHISREWGRIFVHSSDPNAAKIIARVFGVVSASPVVTCDSSIESITKTAADVAESVIKKGESFAVRSRRSGNHSFKSPEIARLCGDAIFERIRKRDGEDPTVDLTNPDHEIFVEVRQSASYIFLEAVKGVGGMPIGTQGKMVTLISGGIDSPVAAWMMMKRGLEMIFVYCNNDPFSDETTTARAIDCIKDLKEWAPNFKFRVYEVPTGECQIEYLQSMNHNMMCLMCRRGMYKIAVNIAEKEGATGIITGASLGQVASQTAANMLAESYGIGFPIYHPLIGMDKTDIVDLAKMIGTFDTSTKPATCCTAVPDKPMTHATVESVQEGEETVNLIQLTTDALEGAKVYDL